MADRRIEYMPVRAIPSAEVNPKEHDDAGIAASIGRFGYVEPMLLDERTGRLISGHGRLRALRENEENGGDPPDGVQVGPDGWEAPVVRGWASRDDGEALAALLAVNRIVERGGWDDRELIQALDGLDLTGVGITEKERDELARALDRLERTPQQVESSRDERLARYTTKESRSIVLDYDAASFDRVTAMAEAARKRRHLRSNADLFLALLERQ